MHPLQPSTVLQSRYRILGSRGRGGQGRVYLAESLQLGRSVAVKEMLEPEGIDDRDAFVSAFQAEARLLGGLDHPGLPRVYDFFHENGRFYLIMEFIDGDTLEEVAAACGGRVSPHLVQSWMADILDVLEYLHARRPPIVFRDLKPDNVLRAADGRIRLVDFGIARLMRQGTRTNRLLANMGSPGYAAPEQYAGASADPRTDLYGLGATAWRLLAGEAPPAAPARAAGAAMLRLRDVGVTPGLEHAVDRLMRLNPAERPSGVAGARLLLSRAGDGNREPAPAPGHHASADAAAAAGSRALSDDAAVTGSREPTDGVPVAGSRRPAGPTPGARPDPHRASAGVGSPGADLGSLMAGSRAAHIGSLTAGSRAAHIGGRTAASCAPGHAPPSVASRGAFGTGLEDGAQGPGQGEDAEGWSAGTGGQLRGAPQRKAWKVVLVGCLLIGLLTLVLGMVTEARPVMRALSYLDGLAGTPAVDAVAPVVPTPDETPVERPRPRIAQSRDERPTAVGLRGPAEPRVMAGEPRPRPEAVEPKPRQSPPERDDRYVDVALAPPVEGERPQDILGRQAREAAAVGQHGRAVELFRAALKIAADDPSLWDDLGLSLDWLERGGESVAAYEAALRLQPDSATFMAHLGSAYARLGQVSKGLVLCERAARMAPRNAAVLNDLALACIAAGDRGTAIRAYRRALDVTPTDGVVWGNLGHLYYAMDDRDKARACYRAALTLAPNQPLVRERAAQVQ